MLRRHASTSDALPRSYRELVSSETFLGSAAATTANAQPGAEMPWFAERIIFQILVHSHTKASRRPGYVPIVTVTRGLSTKIRVDGEFRWAMVRKFGQGQISGDILVLVGRVLCVGGEWWQNIVGQLVSVTLPRLNFLEAQPHQPQKNLA